MRLKMSRNAMAIWAILKRKVLPSGNEHIPIAVKIRRLTRKISMVNGQKTTMYCFSCLAAPVWRCTMQVFCSFIQDIIPQIYSVHHISDFAHDSFSVVAAMKWCQEYFRIDVGQILFAVEIIQSKKNSTVNVVRRQNRTNSIWYRTMDTCCQFIQCILRIHVCPLPV